MKRRRESDAAGSSRKKQRVPQIGSRGEVLLEMTLLQGFCSVEMNLRLAEVSRNFREKLRNPKCFHYTRPIRVQLSDEATEISVQRAIRLISTPLLTLDCAKTVYPIRYLLIMDSLRMIETRREQLKLAREMGYISGEVEVSTLIPYFLEHIGLMPYSGKVAEELCDAYPKDRQAAFASLE